MNHFFDTKCCCSIFESKNISLKILCIHKILTTIENFYMDNANLDFINKFYECSLAKEIFFHIKVKMIHMSQHKNSNFIMECNLETLFFVLKNYYDLSKIVKISIEMLSYEKYSRLKLEKIIHKNVNFEIFT